MFESTFGSSAKVAHGFNFDHSVMTASDGTLFVSNCFLHCKSLQNDSSANGPEPASKIQIGLLLCIDALFFLILTIILLLFIAALMCFTAHIIFMNFLCINRELQARRTCLAPDSFKKWSSGSLPKRVVHH